MAGKFTFNQSSLNRINLAQAIELAFPDCTLIQPDRFSAQCTIVRVLKDSTLWSVDINLAQPMDEIVTDLIEAAATYELEIEALEAKMP